MLSRGCGNLTIWAMLFSCLFTAQRSEKKRNLVLGFGYWFEDLGFDMSMPK